MRLKALKNTAKSNLNTVKKEKQLEPEGLPQRNTVPVDRLSSPADLKKNNKKVGCTVLSSPRGKLRAGV